MSLLTALLGPPRRPASLNAEWRGRMGSAFGSWFTPSGTVVTPDNALQTTAVLACVRVIAEGLAQTPWHVYQRLDRNRKTLAEKHLLTPVLRRPNRWQTPFAFKEFMGVCLALRGNFYAHLRPGVQGAASELWPLHPDRVRIERLPTGDLRYQVREANGSETPYTQGEIFHVAWMSLDGVTGVTPIAYAAHAIGLSRAAEAHGAAFFRNGARPGVVLETDKPMTPDNIKETLRGWNEMHRGADHAHKTAILPFNLKAHELGLTNSDAQFLETRRFQTEEIARIFRCPPHMIGDLSRSTNNNIQQQSLEFLTFTLLPWLIRIEQAADRDLLMDDERNYIKFNIEGFKRGDQASRSAFYREMVNTGIFCIDECRELEDMDPLPNGLGRVHFIQGAMVPLDRLVNPPAPTPPALPPAPAREESEEQDAEELRRTADALRHALATFDVMLEGEQRRRRSAVKRLRESKSATEASRLAAAEAERAVTAERGQVASLQEQLSRGEIELDDLRRQLAESAARVRKLDDDLTTSVRESLQHYEQAAEAKKRADGAGLAAIELIKQTAEAMLKLEGDRAKKAVRRANFLSELDSLRADQADRMLRAMEPATAILSEAFDRRYNLATAVEAYVAKSHADLLDAAGEATSVEELAASVEKTLSSWSARPAEFAQALLDTESKRETEN